MKNALYTLIALGMISTFASAKWIEPSGTGFTYLEKAKRECRAVGARLPTFNELKRVAQSCGIRVTMFGLNGNEVSRAFHSCVRRKGFRQETYLTSSPSKVYRNYLKGVNFYNTATDTISPTHKAFIRCVR